MILIVYWCSYSYIPYNSHLEQLQNLTIERKELTYLYHSKNTEDQYINCNLIILQGWSLWSRSTISSKGFSTPIQWGNHPASKLVGQSMQEQMSTLTQKHEHQHNASYTLNIYIYNRLCTYLFSLENIWQVLPSGY